jgi:hypothetical protein
VYIFQFFPKLKIYLEASVHCLSPPNTYSFVQEENLGSTRKFVENYILFTCITNKILALHPWSMGWRNLSKTAEKEFLQPTRSKYFGVDLSTTSQKCTATHPVVCGLEKRFDFF